MVKEFALGLDLGTTQSYLAFTERNDSHAGKVSLARFRSSKEGFSDEGDLERVVMPSKVFLKKSGDGKSVSLQLALDSKDDQMLDWQPFARFKSCLGKERDKLPAKYELTSATGESAGHVWPEAIAGFLLWRMKQTALFVDPSLADARFNNITVTVPALCTALQRKATQFAAHLAGFQGEIFTLEEPIAAFLNEYHNGEDQILPNLQRGFVVIVDIGGGTCDLSIMQLRGKQLPIVAARQSAPVGGENIDELIARMWLNQVSKAPSFEELSLSDQNTLRTHARSVKEQLSKADPASSNVAMLPSNTVNMGKRDLNREQLKFILTQQSVKITISDDVEKDWKITELLTELVNRLLRKANVEKKDVEMVILVGGSSKLKVIHEHLAALFPEVKHRAIPKDPETAIAKGAAVHQFYRHHGNKHQRQLVEMTLAKETRLHHSLNRNEEYIGLEILGKENQKLPIVHRGWFRLPLFVENAAPIGTNLDIKIEEGTSKRTVLHTDKIDVRGMKKLQVEYQINESGIIENFICFHGSRLIPPILRKILKSREGYEQDIIFEGRQNSMLLKDLDISKYGLIDDLRERYGINVD